MLLSLRSKVIACVVCVGLLLCAFSAGRFSAPVHVETRETERVVYKDKVVEKIVTVEVKSKAEDRIVYRDIVTHSDGTVTDHSVEHVSVKEDTKKTDQEKKVDLKSGSSEKVTEKIVTLRPDWRVSVQAGASIQEPKLKIYGPLVLGAEVDRRIVGGFSVGVWGSTSGAGGLALGLEF